jgi:hypothetical protein
MTGGQSLGHPAPTVQMGPPAHFQAGNAVDIASGMPEIVSNTISGGEEIKWLIRAAAQRSRL